MARSAWEVFILKKEMQVKIWNPESQTASYSHNCEPPDVQNRRQLCIRPMYLFRD